MPAKNLWEARLHDMRDRGLPRKDWNSMVARLINMIARLIINHGKTVNKVKKYKLVDRILSYTLKRNNIFQHQKATITI